MSLQYLGGQHGSPTQPRKRRTSESVYANIMPATPSNDSGSAWQTGLPTVFDAFASHLPSPDQGEPHTGSLTAATTLAQHISSFQPSSPLCYISPAASGVCPTPHDLKGSTLLPGIVFDGFDTTLQTRTPEVSPYRTQQPAVQDVFAVDLNSPLHTRARASRFGQTLAGHATSPSLLTPVDNIFSPIGNGNQTTYEQQILGLYQQDFTPMQEDPPANSYGSLSHSPASTKTSQAHVQSVYQYLAGPDCTADSRLTEHDPPRMRTEHSWFDVRNVTSWDDFNMAAITSIPEMAMALVQSGQMRIPAPLPLFAYHGKQLLQQTIGKLCVRVNEALGTAQGQSRIVLMASTDQASRFQPDFVSSYATDTDLTIPSGGKRRVVGILKASSHWNTQMRNGHAPDKKRYLAGLSDVHQAMRIHGTRYGFIITEFELVCVRYRATSNDRIPLYGALELSPAVSITAIRPATLHDQAELTAGMALFYLHMLAQDTPLTGQLHWSLDVGPPKLGTRKIHLPQRDEWMPDVLKLEERKMMTARKWVYPKDKISRYERQLGEGGKRRHRRRDGGV